MSSNDNPSVSIKEKGLHYAVMSLMIFMIALAAVVSYFAMHKPKGNPEALNPPVVEPVGEIKPLPDYLIENIKKDELELLKP